MRVLLLHPEDQLPAARPGKAWDLVVDLGRAPAATYERWSRRAGCRVISLYDFAQDFEDLRQVRKLLQLGMGEMVDAWGVDWWDVLSLLIEPELHQLMLVDRLSRELERGCELHASRSSNVAMALQGLVGAKRIHVEASLSPFMLWARHYREVFSQLDSAQMSQAFQDKFDRQHLVRRRFARRRQTSRHPVVLLPSAYVNVSRTATSYAALLPDEKFLLVYARNSAHLKTLPLNVRATSLDSYFVTADRREAAALVKAWKSLKVRLVTGAEEYAAANAIGVLARIPELMRWGIALRDAWNQVFASESVVACLCADDSNPYTRLPLILAKNRGVPTVACHHGAFDSRMAVKRPYADIYLAKGEIERDYLLGSCGVPADKVVLGGQGLPAITDAAIAETAKPWPDRMNPGWCFLPNPIRRQDGARTRCTASSCQNLWSLAQSCGLKLVFKIHPFESVKGLRRIIRKHLPEHVDQGREYWSDRWRALAAIVEKYALRLDRAIDGGVAVCLDGNPGVPVFVAAGFEGGICRAVREVWCRAHSEVGRRATRNSCLAGKTRQDDSAAACAMGDHGSNEIARLALANQFTFRSDEGLALP